MTEPDPRSCGPEGRHPVPDGAAGCACGTVTVHPAKGAGRG